MLPIIEQSKSQNPQNLVRPTCCITRAPHAQRNNLASEHEFPIITKEWQKPKKTVRPKNHDLNHCIRKQKPMPLSGFLQMKIDEESDDDEKDEDAFSMCSILEWQ